MAEKRYPRIRIKESDFPYDFDQHNFRYFLEVENNEGKLLGVFFMPRPFYRKLFSTYKNFEEHYRTVGSGVEPEQALEIFFGYKPHLLERFDEFRKLDSATQIMIKEKSATMELLQNYPDFFEELRSWVGYFDFSVTNYAPTRTDMDYEEVVDTILICASDAFLYQFNPNLELQGDPFDLIYIQFENEDNTGLGDFIGHGALDDILDIFRVYDGLDLLAQLCVNYCDSEDGDEATVLEFIQEASPIIFTAENYHPFVERFIAAGKPTIVAFLLEFIHEKFGVDTSDYTLD